MNIARRGTESNLARVLRDQHLLIQREQALRLGVNRNEIAGRLARGEWEQVHRGVYRSTSSVPTFEQRALAACFAAGPDAVASHHTAAWLWDLLGKTPPRTPDVTLPRPSHPRLSGAILHRSRDLDLTRTVYHRGVPCTDPARTLCDLSAVTSPEVVTGAVDRALARGLLSTRAITAEVGRRSSRGRRGIRALEQILADRGLAGGPEPSVLEAEALRLFARWGIVVRAREVVSGPDGRYRIDFVLDPPVAVEVDGYAYHWSPEAKARDEQRRNQVRLSGTFLLVYTWRDIRFDARRVGREVTAALGRYAA
jgi:putative AbiEi antitoxin of type IV toxin-antitoxin system